MSDLPAPGKPRWQPLRAGLVDLFYYDHEEFRFHDGRLLLRGNNGTGKSKVMALTLPFLLDGRLTPARIEPDGDSSKRMEWNLLLGEMAERQGYAWLEFGRLGEEGPEFCTIGCGLKAVSGRSVRSWFFVTPQRVGEELFLVDDGRTLGRERLQHALGSHGRLFDQAHAYRRTLDEQLFELGEERFDALLDLLLQLRQPQLSKRPDESRLSHALTEALPPLDQAVIADVAEAYRNLDAERDETRALEEAHEAVAEFLHHYREYAGIAGRRRAAEVRRAHNEYEQTRAAVHHNQTALEDAGVEEQRLTERDTALEVHYAEAEQQRQTLRDSPAMRSAETLENAESRARQQRQYADQLAELLKNAEEHRHRLEERLGTQRDITAQARGKFQELFTALEEAATAAGISDTHATARQRLGLPERIDAEPQQARDQLIAVQTRRQEGMALVRTYNGELAAAEARVGSARDHWQQQRDELERLDQARQDAIQAAEIAAVTLVEEWRMHLGAVTELTVPDTEATLADLSDWTRHLDDTNPAEQQLAVQRDARAHEIAPERARLTQAHEHIQAALQALTEERERLEGGGEVGPPQPHTRAAEGRERRPGAPLWKLLEFRDAVPPVKRAGLEAALESAGLLDAWVMPDGAVLDADTWDTLLTLEGPRAEENLGQAVVPSVEWQAGEDTARAETVGGILARIGLGSGADGPAWVSSGGTWGLGPARGAWHKAAAQYIGHAAREASRQARLREIADEETREREALEQIDTALQALTTREETIQSEWHDRPGDVALRSAHADEAAAIRAVNVQTGRTENARAVLEQERETAAARREQRDQAAADLALPAEEDDLARIDEALRAYAETCRTLPDILGTCRREEARLREQEQDTEAAVQDARTKAGSAEDAEQQARASETRRDTLRASLGRKVEELQRQLHAVEQTLERLKRDRKALTGERSELAERIGTLKTTIRNGEERLAEFGEQRRTAIEGLQQFAAEGLVPLATGGAVSIDEQASWAAEPAVQLARRMEHALSELDDSDAAWQRHQKGLHEHFTTLQRALGRHGHNANVEQQDDLLIVRIIFQGRHRGPDDLTTDLAEEIRRRRELLTARERELVENYLIDEVASHLQHRLMETEQQVRQMNAELTERPTSTGMRLRIQWLPLAEGESAGGLSAPPGLDMTRNRLLRQSMDAWTPEDRGAVGEFIHARIQEARDNDEGGALPDVLERALDYRYWHRFTVERRQNSYWRPAYGPASGGERALVITLPLFAAAASHYGSAKPTAPRLIMLDEVFAGVDDDARAKSMGLLAQFDLDVMMTSEREWGCYPEVPGLAIAQLVRREGVDAVHVSRWRWDGSRRIREPAPETPVEAEGPAEIDESVNESLL